jgi:hypothetical protein
VKPFASAAVERAFAAYPPLVRRKLLALRALIFRTAAATDGVGELEETLKWGEPAYVTARSGSGSIIRTDWKKARPAQYAMYFHCQTDLIATFRTIFPHEFTYEGNRAIVFDADAKPPADALSFCVAAALTYHQRRKARRS